jgi:hypothetical protein
MPTQPYKNKNGDKIKSVTTIINSNCGWNKEPLMAWQSREYKKGFEIYRELIRNNPELINEIIEIPNDPTKKKKKAGDTGTLCHYYITMDFYKKEKDPIYLSLFNIEQLTIAERSLNQCKKKLQENNLVIIDNEISLISEQYQYGGTLDARLLENNIITILGDVKSGNGIYEDQIIQLGAYNNLLIENNYPEPEKYLFIHINKDPIIEDEEIIHLIWIEKEKIKLGFETFLLLKKLNDIKPGLKL